MRPAIVVAAAHDFFLMLMFKTFSVPKGDVQNIKKAAHQVGFHATKNLVSWKHTQWAAGPYSAYISACSLLPDLNQVVNRHIGVECVERLVVPLHGFGRSSFENRFAAYVAVASPIAVKVSDPVKDFWIVLFSVPTQVPLVFQFLKKILFTHTLKLAVRRVQVPGDLRHHEITNEALAGIGCGNLEQTPLNITELKPDAILGVPLVFTGGEITTQNHPLHR